MARSVNGPSVSPTFRQWELGARLRDLRNQAGLTVDDVAEALLCSPAKISRLETGQRRAQLRDVRDLCDLYQVQDDGDRTRLMDMAREARLPAWWQEYDVGDHYATYMGLEAAAVAISNYELAVVPGLLQTPEYTAAVVQALQPDASSDEVRQHRDVRADRQRLLNRDHPPRLSFLIDEAALHRQVGGPGVMHHQMLRLIEVAALPNVTIRIVPFSVGVHQGVRGGFVILEFAEDVTLSRVVYIEDRAGERYLDKPADLAAYGWRFEQIRSVAANQDESLNLIELVGQGWLHR